jgi:hypothetical protein
MDLADVFKMLLDQIRDLPPSREQSISVRKLEECAFWTSLASRGITSGIDWIQEDSETPPGDPDLS